MNNFKEGGFKKRGNGFEGRSKSGGHRGSDNKSGGGKFGGSKPTGGRPADMFKAECSTCHKDCMLPFRPNAEKPVYCRDCFAKKNADNARDDGGRHGGARSDNTKAPRSERSPRHDRPAQPNYELTAIKQQLKTIEDRLNRVLDIINPPLPPVKSFKAEVVAAAVAVETPVKKSAPAKKVAPKKVAAKKAAPAKKVAAKKATPVKKAVAKKAAAKKVAPKKAVVKKVTKAKK